MHIDYNKFYGWIKESRHGIYYLLWREFSINKRKSIDTKALKVAIVYGKE